MSRGCARPGCCGSGCSSTTISAAAKILPGDRAPSISPHDPLGEPLKRDLRAALNIPIAGSDDARLVVLNARRCRRARRRDPHPHALHRAPSAAATSGSSCSNARGQRDSRHRARAGQCRPGPGRPQFADRCAARDALGAHVRLVKGSHIVVRAPVRARSRLYFPERRRAHRVRAAVRAAISR